MTLVAVGLIIRWVRFETVLERAGYEAAPLQAMPGPSIRSRNRLARSTGARTERWAQRLFTRRPCMASALAAGVILRRSGHPNAVVLGVRLEGGRIDSAHAWLVDDDGIITGGNGGMDHVPVARFRSDVPLRR